MTSVRSPTFTVPPSGPTTPFGSGTGDGLGDGLGDGDADGSGAADGSGEGAADGSGDGAADGSGEGAADGSGDGAADGSGEGEGSGPGSTDGVGPGSMLAVGSREAVGSMLAAGAREAAGSPVSAMAGGMTGVNASTKEATSVAPTMSGCATRERLRFVRIIRVIRSVVVIDLAVRSVVTDGRTAGHHEAVVPGYGTSGAGVGPEKVPAVIVPVGSWHAWQVPRLSILRRRLSLSAGRALPG
jgi:hypothetical protein